RSGFAEAHGRRRPHAGGPEVSHNPRGSRMAGTTQNVAPFQGGRVAPSLTRSAPNVETAYVEASTVETSSVEVSVGGFRWWLAPHLKHLLLGPTGLKLAEWLQAGQARVVKKGPHRIVYRVDLPELHFYVKRNLVADRSCWVRQLIRPSKAHMEYQRARGVA